MPPGCDIEVPTDHRAGKMLDADTRRRIRRFSDALGNGRPSYLFRLAAMFLGFRLGVNRTWNLRTHHDGKNHDWQIRSRKDIRAIEDVFIDHEYLWGHDLKPRTIFDLGAYIGDTAVYFSHQYPRAEIHAFEPHPEIYELLVANTRELQNIHCHQMAVGGTGGVLPLYHGGSRLGSSLHRRGEAHPNRTMVPVVSLPAAMRHTGTTAIDLLKFDIEGAEQEVFADPVFMNYVENAIGEVHEDLMDISGQDFVERFSMYRTTARVLGEHRFMLAACRSF
jgi:FkbM family methyltransferase